MRNIDSAVSLDLHAILVPCSSHVLVRHLALEHGLILGLHREVGDALVDLQFFLCTSRGSGNRAEQKSTWPSDTNMPEFIEPKLDAILMMTCLGNAIRSGVRHWRAVSWQQTQGEEVHLIYSTT